MRVAYYSLEGSTLSWARRLLDEGCEVLMYIKCKETNDVGMGIVPKTKSAVDWLAWGKQSADTIYFFDCTDAGKFADSIRKTGGLVVGGGEFMDRLETDREWGEDFAKRAGILCPPTKKFSTASASIAFLQSNPEQEHGDGGWAWKPDRNLGTDVTLVSSDTEKMIKHIEHTMSRFGDSIACIVQEKIAGVALSTARWWNGRDWVGPYEGTLEEKKFLNDDLGSATGCSLNTLWFYRDTSPKIAEELQFNTLAGMFRAKNAPPGLYDINCIVNKKGAWFLEWTPRLGIDSELTSPRAISSLSGLLFSIAVGGPVEEYFNTDTAYHTVRVSVPPYPNECKGLEAKSPALNVPVKGADGIWDGYFVGVGLGYDSKMGLHCVDPYGFIGSVGCADESISEGYDRIYTYLKDTLDIPNLQYRTDAAKIVQDDVDEMEKLGWETTPVMRA